MELKPLPGSQNARAFWTPSRCDGGPQARESLQGDSSLNPALSAGRLFRRCRPIRCILPTCPEGAVTDPVPITTTEHDRKYSRGISMKRATIVTCIWVGLSCGLSPAGAAEEPREFFDGIEARNVGPFRGGRATVAVGVRQNPHVYYMGTTGGVWKTENAGASWRPVSDDDFGTAAVGAIAVAPSDPNVVVVGMGESPFRNIASSPGR